MFNYFQKDSIDEDSFNYEDWALVSVRDLINNFKPIPIYDEHKGYADEYFETYSEEEQITMDQYQIKTEIEVLPVEIDKTPGLGD